MDATASALAYHQQVLRRLLAMLLVYAGLTDENEQVRSHAGMRERACHPFTLSRKMRAMALRLLVPVEAATRRLIVVLASRLSSGERYLAARLPARPAALSQNTPTPSPTPAPLGGGGQQAVRKMAARQHLPGAEHGQAGRAQKGASADGGKAQERANGKSHGVFLEKGGKESTPKSFPSQSKTGLSGRSGGKMPAPRTGGQLDNPSAHSYSLPPV